MALLALTASQSSSGAQEGFRDYRKHNHGAFLSHLMHPAPPLPPPAESVTPGVIPGFPGNVTDTSTVLREEQESPRAGVLPGSFLSWQRGMEDKKEEDVKAAF